MRLLFSVVLCATFGSSALAERVDRDPFGAMPNVRRSEHFALKWGSAKALSDSLADTILEGGEAGWQTLVAERGFPAPRGTDQYFYNIYIGNSGDGAPVNNAGTALTELDASGYPFINLDLDLLTDLSYVESLVTHELFHAVQDALGWPLYPLGSPDMFWFSEASAEWAAEQTFPNGDDNEVGAFLLHSEVPLTYYVYEWSGVTGTMGSHQYGASVFLTYLSDVVADGELVKQLVLQAPTTNQLFPLLEQALGTRWPGTIEELFADFAAHTAALDYRRAKAYLSNEHDWFAYEHDGAPEQLALTGVGTAGFVDVPAATWPQQYGYNTIRLTAPQTGWLEVGVEGTATGTYGTDARFSAAVARRTGMGIEYLRVPMDAAGLHGSLTVHDVQPDEELDLVVAALPATTMPSEQFSYRVRMEITPPGEDVAESGCAMAGTRAPIGASWLVIALVAWAMRRRRAAT